MKQVALIGNSHLGCLRQWCADDAPDLTLAGHGLTFFGAPADHLTRVRRVGRKLRSMDKATAVHFIRTSGKGSDVWLDHYDAFVLHGLCFPALPLNNLLKNFSVSSGNSRPFMSVGCLRASLHDFILRSPFLRLASEIRAASSAPLVLSMGPCLAESMLQARPDDVDQVVECAPFLKKIYLDALYQIAGDLELDLQLQPEETLASPLLTKAAYSLRHVNPNLDDHGHMNKDYGGVAMRPLGERLATLTQAAA